MGRRLSWSYMNSDRESNSRKPPVRPRLQFSLLALLLFTAALCAVLFWLTRPRPLEVVALLNVDSQPNNMAGPGNTARDWAIVQRTQLAHLKSVGVLQDALNDPQVSKLPLVTSQADPVEWLLSELQVKFVQNSEILSVRLTSPANQAAQARTLLSAVISAYLQSAAAAEQQQLQSQLQSQQAEYDALSAQIEELSKKIATARSQRGADDPVAKLMQLESDRHVEQANKLKAYLDVGKSLQSGPPRVRLIQPPTAVK